jgi:hypothetical protein
MLISFAYKQFFLILIIKPTSFQSVIIAFIVVFLFFNLNFANFVIQFRNIVIAESLIFIWNFMFLFHSIIQLDDFAEFDLLETTVRNYCKLYNTFYDIFSYHLQILKKYYYENSFYFVKSKCNGETGLSAGDIYGQYRMEFSKVKNHLTFYRTRKSN